MIKNEENKKVTASDIVNNSTEFNASTRPTTFQKMKKKLVFYVKKNN